MTIIIFLIDTSASMNQRTYLGTSLLDVAKGAVETFMKIRSRDPSSRWDRYMLLTFEEPPANVKAGWKESHAAFVSELKNLQAHGLSSLGPALKRTFDLLNVNRMQSGIDTYGQGRCPFYLEPAVIICLTDGQHLTTMSRVEHELNLPMNTVVPGSELTKEPFRWDQRIFGIALRIPAVPPSEIPSVYIPSADDSPMDAMCEVTGGRSYLITSQRLLLQCLESLVQKCQPGVVVCFEKMGADPPPVNEENGDLKIRAPSPTIQPWHNCRKLIYVNRSAQKGYCIGHWPIPESFWPDMSSPSLPPRSSHPVLKFSCTPCDPLIVENLPFDKYELEPSPLTQYLLERRQPNVAWQVFIANSAKYSDIGHPFGYMKASTNLQTVNLFVMPYNYPALIPLLDDLLKVHKMKPTQKWRQHFDNYLKTMPVYYATPLRRALSRMGVPNLVPDQMDSCLSYAVVSYLKKLKNQGKLEYDRLIASVGQKVAITEGIKVTSRSQTSILQRKDFNELLEYYGGSMSHLKQELTDYNTFTLAVPDKELKPQSFKNPYDIPRKNLLDQLSRMRANFLQPGGSAGRLQVEDQLHNIPVQQMGNYQEYLKKMPEPLREIETTPVRVHTFGNPFKVNKNLMIDEADEAMPGQQASKKRSAEPGSASPRPNKRKPGPLPKDVPVRLLISPTPDAASQEAAVTEKLNTPKHLPSYPGATPSEQNGLISIEDDSDLEEVDHLAKLQIVTNHIDGGSDDDSSRRISLDSVELDIEDVNEEMDTASIRVNNHKKLMVAKDQNVKLKKLVIREVKRPGRNYDQLFGHLKKLEGSLDTKCLFLHDIVYEAMRFKKKILVQLLQNFEQSLVKAEQKKLRTVNAQQKSPNR